MANKYPIENTTYQTSDTLTFDNINEAKIHQNELDFIDWVKKSNLIVENAIPSIDDISRFLFENRTNIQEFFKDNLKGN